jgi:uncharacterized protein (DUF1330 family)
MAIDPTEQSLTDLATDAATNAEPIAMLNLLKFDGVDGAASYQRYAEEVQSFLASVGASVVYAGDVSRRVIGEADDPTWDAVLVVRYPSRAAFLAMVTDPGYLEIHRHREAALTSAELIATDPWT